MVEARAVGFGDLVRYIAKDHAGTAIQFGERIIKKAAGLAGFPRIGRIVPEFREEVLREIVFAPYRIVYEIDDGQRVVSILRIWHGAREHLELPKAN